MSDPFFRRYHRALADAADIVTSRDAEGRNASMGIEAQYESTVFVIDIVRMKCQRAKSYLAAGNLEKFREEMLDCMNYSAFAAALEDRGEE
jgi:hypothetical protein